MVTRWVVVIVVGTACDAGAKREDVQPPLPSNVALPKPRPSQPPPVPPTTDWRDPCSLSIFLSDRYNIVDVDDHCHSGMISGSIVREDPSMLWIEDQLKYAKTWHGGGCTTVEIATDNTSQADLDHLRAIAVKVGFVDARFTAQRDFALKFPDSENPTSCEPRSQPRQAREAR